jgi:chitin disaccharide deacetylase
MRRAAVAIAMLAAAPAWAQTVQERLGHRPSARLLMIHADDLGMSQSVNSATFEALEKHWITAASIMVPCPWFPEVTRWAAAHPDADLGLHLVLNSEWTGFRWGPLSGAAAVPSLVDEHGYFPLLETTVAKRAKPPEVEQELRAQIERARAAGIRFSHFDSHMAALFHTAPFLELLRRLGAAYGVEVQLEKKGERGGEESDFRAPAGEALLDRVVAMSPGVTAAQWLARYEEILRPLPPGVYQLTVHLGHDDAEMRAATSDHPDWGAGWRQQDYDLVRSEAFAKFLREQGFVLVGWRDIARARQ